MSLRQVPSSPGWFHANGLADNEAHNRCHSSKVELVQLRETAAVGAAALAAKDIHAPLHLDYTKFYQPFFTKA